MRVAVKTLGCRLNQAESAGLTAGFMACGFEVVPFGSDCDVCLIHSCAVTATAERETVRLSRAARRRWPSAFIVLAGCMAEASAAEVVSRSCADWVVPQRDKDEVPARLAARFGMVPLTEPGQRRLTPMFHSTRAALRVQDGCSFGCAYCIVPKARGPARSRPMRDILVEARALADRGHRELVLTGANIGTWRDEGVNLVGLLAELERIAGIERLRVGSVEPATVESPLIDFMSSSAKLCRYLHLPLQSGDDSVLRAMGRRYSTAAYRSVIDRATELMPMVGLGTDIITGFPGESDSAFRNTKALIEAYPFSNLHVFPYSERPGTHAASLHDSVPPATRRGRARELIALGETKRQEFASRFVGLRVSALIERRTRTGRMAGWTGEYLEAEVADRTAAPGEVATFTAARAMDGTLLDT
jgi:threonylcarbamoyladenosine tRNA methylthiotransferase MtaB